MEEVSVVKAALPKKRARRSLSSDRLLDIEQDYPRSKRRAFDEEGSLISDESM